MILTEGETENASFGLDFIEQSSAPSAEVKLLHFLYSVPEGLKKSALPLV